jgi:monovalent cation/hydrogen antiporter
MRGIVSLAAALALPEVLASGAAFPNRDLIIFLTFCVIFSTLVLQGLTLPVLVRWLNVQSGNAEHKEEQEARLQLTSAVIEHIEENYALLEDSVLNQIKTKYEIRIQRIRKDQIEQKLDNDQIHELHRIQHELIRIERTSLLQMRRKGQISEEVVRRLEYELDLEETRLILEKGE